MRLLGLTVQNVRGLPDLHIKLDGKNIVIWGPNGAGKSCVVDAIDFLFSGRISRLIGEGTAGISLSRHGPHIDHDADSAIVTATVQLEGIPEPIELSRCMAQPDQLVCPDEVREPLAKMRDLMRAGGIVLTRRDILRYVAAEAGKRANEIEELLHLKDVDDVRSSFRRARTELDRKEKAAKTAIDVAKAEVNVTLGLTTYSPAGLLEAVNDSRQALGGRPLDVPDSNRLKEGIAPPGPRAAEPTSANFNLLHQAIQIIRREAPTSRVPSLVLSDQNLRDNITKLRGNPGLFAEA